MALFVHIAPDKALRSIRRTGLKPGKHSRGVFALPATPDFYASHQWVRELRRFTPGSLRAVYFRLAGDTPVIFGHYGGPHTDGTADGAVGGLMKAEDKLGWEAIVLAPVPASAITSVRPLRQVTGWRFYPGAKGRKPCGCPGCISRGEPFSRKLKAAYAAEIDD